MDACFTVLASGSGGNASLLEVGGFGLLIDCGLSPRLLSARLAAIGRGWQNIHAVILTHTHADHWKDATLACLRSWKVPLIAHEAHLHELDGCSPAFAALHSAKLTQRYEVGQPLVIGPGWRCHPIRVPHDAEPTCAFHFDSGPGSPASLGYLCDLGHAPTEMLEAFPSVSVLALEFNHDVELQQRSPRPEFLIQRVLSPNGHLSNDQAADLTRALLTRHCHRPLRTLIQLHLSRQCNTPELARSAAREATRGQEVRIITATQHAPTPTIPLPG